MTEFQQCALGALACTSPIWIACLIGAVGWLIKTARRERKIWREACDEASEYMKEVQK